MLSVRWRWLRLQHILTLNLHRDHGAAEWSRIFVTELHIQNRVAPFWRILIPWEIEEVAGRNVKI